MSPSPILLGGLWHVQRATRRDGRRVARDARLHCGPTRVFPTSLSAAAAAARRRQQPFASNCDEEARIHTHLDAAAPDALIGTVPDAEFMLYRLVVLAAVPTRTTRPPGRLLQE